MNPTPNIDPVSGYTYGYVAAADLDATVVDNLLHGGPAVTNFLNETYRAVREQAEREARLEWENNCETLDIARQEDGLPPVVHADFEFDEDKFNDSYEDAEPIVSGCYHDVAYLSSWLGGALNFFILKSPHITTNAHRASPCVPNAGILKPPGERSGDVYAYDVPPTWWLLPTIYTIQLGVPDAPIQLGGSGPDEPIWYFDDKLEYDRALEAADFAEIDVTTGVVTKVPDDDMVSDSEEFQDYLEMQLEQPKEVR